MIPKGAKFFAITSQRRKWKIYASRPKQKRWLASLGLDEAVFPTRRDALAQLKEALKGAVP